MSPAPEAPTAPAAAFMVNQAIAMPHAPGICEAHSHQNKFVLWLLKFKVDQKVICTSFSKPAQVCTGTVREGKHTYSSGIFTWA
jgi:hypothetical protein